MKKKKNKGKGKEEQKKENLQCQHWEKFIYFFFFKENKI